MADLKTAFDSLKETVAKQQTVDASVLALVQGMKTQLDALAQQETIDPAEVQELADTLNAEQMTLSFLVTQGTGTPAAPGTPANPIIPAIPDITGGAITTDPVIPEVPAATEAPIVPETSETPEVPVTELSGGEAALPGEPTETAPPVEHVDVPVSSD